MSSENKEEVVVEKSDTVSNIAWAISVPIAVYFLCNGGCWQRAIDDDFHKDRMEMIDSVKPPPKQ